MMLPWPLWDTVRKQTLLASLGTLVCRCICPMLLRYKVFVWVLFLTLGTCQWETQTLPHTASFKMDGGWTVNKINCCTLDKECFYKRAKCQAKQGRVTVNIGYLSCRNTWTSLTWITYTYIISQYSLIIMYTLSEVFTLNSSALISSWNY